ncbi:MAG: hypothetical protein ACI4I1_10160 [Oscillospiraceae bacterium]
MKTKLIAAAAICLICFSSCGTTNDNIEEQQSSTETQQEITDTNIVENDDFFEETEIESETESETEVSESSSSLVFTLTAGESGEYGKELVYNAGTEFEEHLIAFYVPEGTYNVTNISDYMTQINVYSDEIKIEDGWEYPVDGQATLLDVLQSAEITVSAGYHIEIGEPTIIEMEQIQ